MSKKVDRKKKKKFDPRSIGLGKLTVENTEEINVGRVLVTAIDKYGVKAILNKISFICTTGGMPYVASMLALLATKEKVELVEGMVVLLYVRDHWNKLVNGVAKDHFKKICGRAEAKYQAAEKKKRGKSET